MVEQPQQGQGLLIVEASRSHSDTPHSVGLLWTSDQPPQTHKPDNKRHSQYRDIHVPGGIRTFKPSKRTRAGPRLELRGNWNRLSF
jgi:hypothetical protein